MRGIQLRTWASARALQRYVLVAKTRRRVRTTFVDAHRCFGGCEPERGCGGARCHRVAAVRSQAWSREHLGRGYSLRKTRRAYPVCASSRCCGGRVRTAGLVGCGRRVGEVVLFSCCTAAECSSWPARALELFTQNNLALPILSIRIISR